MIGKLGSVWEAEVFVAGLGQFFLDLGNRLVVNVVLGTHALRCEESVDDQLEGISDHFLSGVIVGDNSIGQIGSLLNEVI